MKLQLNTLTPLLALSTTLAFADTTWISTGNSTWSTAGNWDNGVPGYTLTIFPDSASVQHAISLVSTPATVQGIQFNAFAGGAGFTFTTPFGTAPGFYSRANTTPGAVNGIINNDDSTQVFNVPVTLWSPNGVADDQGAQTWNAASGNLVFGGPSTATGSSINLNGARLTFDGAFNITVGRNGVANGRGSIVGIGGITKNGGGTLTLAGTNANTFTGGVTINAGTIIADKANALVNNSIIFNGGTFQLNGINQTTSGTLNLQGNAAIDFGAATTETLTIAKSAGLSWKSGSKLSILNWRLGDSLKFGSDATGLTQTQLNMIDFVGWDETLNPVRIDGSGFVTVPEPSTAVLGLLGFAILARWIQRRK
jgi:autotransporter-associated beta strand protein